ncbi:MAG: hypothetical protein E3J60_04555 [Dehalococcoidia bacterium]|nr:MAG: hypothetical protein E3J60_04555 [Dehalococcoidia bacterium]
MTKPRKLVKGDRVKVTGGWGIKGGGSLGEHYIGCFATVVGFTKMSMPITIKLDEDIDTSYVFNWCRENLRALPRKAKAL